MAVGVGDPIRTFAGRDGRGCCADADGRDKATRARVDDAQRVAGRRDGRAASASTLTEHHERNHHSGSDHAGDDDDCGREPPTPAAASRRRPGGLFLGLRGRRRCRRLFSKGRRGQKLTVDRVGLGRRIRSKLLRQEPPAPFVDLERLGPVARGRVCLHQPPVPGLAERLEGDHLVGPLRRLCGVAETQGCVPEHRQCAALEIGQLSALLVDPGAGFARQERLTHQGRGQPCSRPRLLELSGGERCLRRVDRVRRDGHIDPGSFREIEPVAAECAGQRSPAVDACVRERTAQLARDHRQRLVPGRGRCLSPERLGELVPRHRPAPFRNQVREDEATLPAREPPSVEHDTVGFDCDTPCEEDPELYGSGHPLGLILPRWKTDRAGAGRVIALERRPDRCYRSRTA